MHFAMLPDNRAHGDPGGACLRDADMALDNAEFLVRVRRAAGILRAQGILVGDVVAVILPNRVELIVAMFAAWRIGAALTPVNPALTRSEIEYQLSDAGAKLVIGAGTWPVPVIGPDELNRGAEDGTPPRSVDSDLALLIYTSGTTGRPKGVLLDHANAAAMVEMVTAAVSFDTSDHCLLILPLFHVNAIFVSVLVPLSRGGRCTILPRFSMQPFLTALAESRPTYFSAVPAIYEFLNELPPDTSADFSSLRFAVCGAAPMPPQLIADVEKRFGVVILEGYGLTEATCGSAMNPLEGVRKPGTVGPPLPGEQIRIDHPNADGVGEVLIRGANVMRGYLGKPQETARALVDGWLHTGDVGYLDTDGYLVLVDRIKDLIIRGGENIYPKEIENALYSYPGVREAAVVGKPDAALGEVPYAFVTLDPATTTTADELRTHLAQSLAGYKIPTGIEFLPDGLPKNDLGKIDKNALRARLATDHS